MLPKDTVLLNRGAVDRVIHIYGDSISRGYGTGVFSDEMSPSDPLYAFRSIWSAINLTLADNSLLTFDTTDPEKIVKGKWLSAHMGPAIGTTGTAALIESRVKAGTIRAGDIVVFEDAGDHGSNPADYQAEWEALRLAVAGKHNVTVIMMTMFDYIDPANTHLMPSCQYDVSIGGVTMNAATIAAYNADLGCVGQTILIDMNARMDKWKTDAFNLHNVAVMNPDGIHPNVWGQMLMAGEIIKACGLLPYISSTATCEAVAAANYAALAYGGGVAFDSSRSASYAKFCLLR